MIEVGTYDAKTRLSELIERAEAGETVVITRHGKPVARLVAEEGERRRRVEAEVEGMLAERAARPVPAVRLTVHEILAMRDDGRRF